MKLRKPCEHGRYEEHDNRDKDGWLKDPHPCPGGEFLADDVLVAITVSGATTEADPNTGEAIQGYPVLTSEGGKIEPTRCMLERGEYVLISLDALTVREGAG